MKINAPALFPLVLMAFLAILTYWLQSVSQTEQTAAASKRHDPDFYADKFTIRRFDQTGTLQSTVTADHMQHYPDDDSTDVAKPTIVFHRARPTRAVADLGNIDSGGKTIILNDNVRIVHDNPNGPPTEILTTTLTVLTEDEIARTKAPVTITQGKSVVRGLGLESNNKTKQSVLGGRAQGTIAAQDK